MILAGDTELRTLCERGEFLEVGGPMPGRKSKARPSGLGLEGRNGRRWTLRVS